LCRYVVKVLVHWRRTSPEHASTRGRKKTWAGIATIGGKKENKEFLYQARIKTRGLHRSIGPREKKKRGKRVKKFRRGKWGCQI